VRHDVTEKFPSPPGADALQRQHSTVYVLNASGTNRWSAQVQPGHDDDGRRVSDAECEAVAAEIRAALAMVRESLAGPSPVPAPDGTVNPTPQTPVECSVCGGLVVGVAAPAPAEAHPTEEQWQRIGDLIEEAIRHHKLSAWRTAHDEPLGMFDLFYGGHTGEIGGEAANYEIDLLVDSIFDELKTGWGTVMAISKPEPKGIPVAWSRQEFIHDDDGYSIGTDEPELHWGKEPPDDEGGWHPLYAAAGVTTRDAALEEAAQLCERWNTTPGRKLAGEIRALASQAPAPEPEGDEPVGWGGVIDRCAELRDPGFIGMQDLDELKRYAGNWNSTYRFFPIYAPGTPSPAPAPEVPADLRDAFEAWVQAGYPGASGKELIGREENSPHPYVYDGIRKQWRAWKAGAAWARSQAPAVGAEPIDMVLHCPKCGMQHIDRRDEPLSADWDDAEAWTNPPHRSHLCHGCRHIWRPADVPTNGVKAIQTKGKADSPIRSSAVVVGDGMLEPLIYAAIMHHGTPKTVVEFERAATNVADMLKRRQAGGELPAPTAKGLRFYRESK